VIRGAFKLARGPFSLDVDFALPGQGVTALFGHSGSGKTSWLRCLAGLERGQGRLAVGDACWQDDATGRFVPTHRRPLGYVFQEASLFPHLDVRDNLLYGRRRITPKHQRVALEEVVDWLGLSRLIDRRPEGLSGGERQRVAIGRALLTSPELLLMDEPMAALDARAREEIMPYLETLHRRLSIPVIYVTHAVDEVARLADHVVQMQDGRVIVEGGTLQLLSGLHRPSAAGEEPGAVIEAEVAGHDERHHLTTLSIGGGLRLMAPRLAAEPGSRARVRIPAREVSLSLGVPQGSSILNILPARITAIEEGDPGRVLVQLVLEGVLEGSLEETPADSGTRLLSRISRYSWDRLGLKPGMVVQAQIKSMGLDREVT
jgi:molybdate transport system ATP-binding protein